MKKEIKQARFFKKLETLKKDLATAKTMIMICDKSVKENWENIANRTEEKIDKLLNVKQLSGVLIS